MNFLVRKSGYIAIFGIAAVYALVAIRGPQGVPTLLEKQRQIRVLQEVNVDLARENEMKRKRIDRLRTSQAEQEMEIRERLKLLRPGETQYILPDSPKSDAAGIPVGTSTPGN